MKVDQNTPADPRVNGGNSENFALKSPTPKPKRCRQAYPKRRRVRKPVPPPEPMSYEAIAKELGISIDEVQRIERRACVKLHHNLLQHCSDHEKDIVGAQIIRHLQHPQTGFEKSLVEMILERFT